MARDLIPPPSPAGRPAPDGTPHLIELPPERTETVAASSLAASGPSEFRNRFGFLMGGLVGVVIAAAAVAAVVIANGGPADEGFASNWSRWQPQETTLTAGPPEIATHVAAQYHADDGAQLVSITGGPLELQGIPLDVRLQSGQGGIYDYDGKHAVLYTLSGLGAGGSIKGGTVSKARHQLLRREALELSLYTFRYMHDVDMVVTQLPPPPPSAQAEAAAATAAAAAATAAASASSSSAPPPATGADPSATAPTQAVFYRPGDLKSQLQVPLGATVPAKAPAIDAIPPAESRTIDALTLPNLFQASPVQTADFKAYMVLDRPK